MATVQYKDKTTGIVFSTVDIDSTPKHALAGKTYPSGWTNAAISGVSNTNTQLQKGIDAIFIDWNGADTTSYSPTTSDSFPTTINTTGDLIKAIKLAYYVASTRMGTVTKVQVGNTDYTPTNGVVSLPAYPSIQSGTSTLSWGTEVTLATIGGTAIKAKLPANPDTDTDTDTLRAIKVNGTQVLSGDKSSGPINFINGSNTTIEWNSTNKTLKINSTDTNTDMSVSDKWHHYHGNLGEKTISLYRVAFDLAGHITDAEEVTSDEIYNMIKDILDQHYQEKTNAAASISVNPTSATLGAYNANQMFIATPSGSAVSSGTTWSITSGSSYATLSATSGSAVTITGKNTQSTPTVAGSASLPSTSPNIAATGSTTIKCTASAASQTAQSRIVTLAFDNTTATLFSPASKQISITVPGQTATSAVKSYSWSATSNASYVTLSNTTSNTVTITGKNTTSNSVSVGLQCVVTWNNNATKTLQTSVLVQGVGQQYYWYVGPDQPTAETDGQVVSAYNSSYQYTHVNSTSNPNADTSRAYILIHNSKSVASVIGNRTQLPVTITDISSTANIANYKVYRTAGLIPGSQFTINIQ